MPEHPQSEATPTPRLSPDTWAVLIALLAAALIRFGLIRRVPW
jgi:MYXO-CTERM domain-containing protein